MRKSTLTIGFQLRALNWLCALLGALAVSVCLGTTANGQLIYRETFNDDGDGTRYVLTDPGYELTTAGPGIWGHNFDAEQIGLGSAAPAHRAAILWGSNVLEDQVEPEALELWSSLVGWATGGKANARIGFFPGSDLTEGDFVLSQLLEGMGHTVMDIDDATSLPAPDQLDLLIHTNQATPVPDDSFVNYAVPLICYNYAFHDDNAIAGIGTLLDFPDAVSIKTFPANESHPALGGKTGSIPFTNEAAQMGGIGKMHAGGKLLATVEDPVTGEDVPALYIVEEGQPLLGAFEPVAEGGGYIVGAALNKFGSMANRTLDINPVDVSGNTDVKLTVALAATDADFDAGDFLTISIDPNNSGDFEVLANFTANPDFAMEDLDATTPFGGVVLSPAQFTDVTFDIPAGATNLAIRFEALTTWGNEIVAIDDIRIYSGILTTPGDFNANGVLDVADIDDLTVQSAGGAHPAAYDLNSDAAVNDADIKFWISDLFNSWIGDANLDGEFNSSDLVTVLASGTYEADVAAVWSTGDFNGDGRANSSDLVAALADGGYEAGPRAAVAAVPEPVSGTLLLVGAMCLTMARRRNS
jgi:hypothetical protein